jgi:hypothetical protein
MSHNFANMDLKSLRAYVIEHQDDNEAFYTFVDRLKANPSSRIYPPPNTPENIAIMEQAIKDKVAALQQKQESNSAKTIKTPDLDYDNMTLDEIAVAFNLDDEEKALMESVENEEWVSVPNFEERKRELQEMATAHLARQTLKINLSLQDSDKISDLAEQAKIPAALLAEQIIHRYLGGELIEKQP